MSAAKWESNDQGHRAVVRAANEFSMDSFRSKKHSKGVRLILGKHSSDASVLQLQSAVFDKESFTTQAEAKRWWTEHGADVDKTYDSRSGSALDNKSIREVGISKTLTTIQAAADSDGAIEGIKAPTPQQLDKINQFTRSPKSSDEVAVLPVLACNDIVDRDIDRFPPETVRGFMELTGPLSPLGKSFMVGHDYRGMNGYNGLPVGRVFDGEAREQNGVTWLALDVYIPNTDQYKSYLENVDYGIYWAVSVGVMLGGAMCLIGEPHEWGWHPYICSQGHEKGMRYDPAASEPSDRFERPEPSESGQLCWRDLVDPLDFYELSQVYLGAQYMAELDKAKTGDDSLIKAASFEMEDNAIEVVSLKSEEVAGLPQPIRFPEGSRVAIAASAGMGVEYKENGTASFTDADGLRWTFDPETGDELCLGRAAEGGDEGGGDDSGDNGESDDSGDDSNDDSPPETQLNDGETDGTADKELTRRLLRAQSVLDRAKAMDEGAATELIVSLDTTLSNAIEAMDEGELDDARALMTAADSVVARLMSMLGIGDADDSGEDGQGDEPTIDNVDLTMEAEEVPKEAVLEAVKTLNMPITVSDAIEAAEDKDAVATALQASAGEIERLNKENTQLATKAQLGDQYITALRADAVHWFVFSQRSSDDDKGVDTTRIEKLLERCGDDTELIKELTEQYKDTARAKFPDAVRRSSFPTDANASEGLAAPRGAEGGEGPEFEVPNQVKRIHG